jgi:hypothetical protein
MGRSLPPSHWAPLSVAVSEAIDDCVEELGGLPNPRPPIESTDSLELKGTDLGEFRRRFGYGVVENARVQESQAKVAPQVEDPDPALPELYGRCASAGDDIMAKALPPQALVMLHDQVLMEMATDPTYNAASKQWSKCMVEAGFDATGVASAYFSKGIVEIMLFDAYDGLVAGQAPPFEALQQEELKAFLADATCLKTSGVGDIMLTLEDRLLSRLRDEFPDYSPPVSDPLGLDWRPRSAAP